MRGWTDVERLRRNGLTAGPDVFIGPDCHVDPSFCHLIDIGAGATLSVRVVVLAHDASTRPHVGFTRIAPVRIGERVFVGAGAIILPGVTIGDDAVIAAGSVVRHDVAAGDVVAGVPARRVTGTQDYLDHHESKLQESPKWPRDGWTATGIDDERRRVMREALADREGYIR